MAAAKDLYEDGIKTSMQQWGITDNTAIQNYIKWHINANCLS